MSRGKLIVFEGIDGSGKTTQARRLRDRINEYLNHNSARIICEMQEEPFHGDVIGGNIRSVLSGQTKMPEDSLAYLYVANRLTHISIMKPKLEAGNHIICDRYYFSNFAYNQTKKIGLDGLIQLNALCMSELKPDAVFYLYISPEIAAKRRGMSRLTEEANDALDRQTIIAGNFEKIMKMFSEPSFEMAHNICRINCDNLTEDMVADAIWDYLTVHIFPNRKFY